MRTSTAQTKTELFLAPCSMRAAKYAVQKWHYSGHGPIGKMVRYGVWEAGVFIGTVIFSSGNTPLLGMRYGLKQTQVCELSRVALDEHDNPVSKVISIAINLLRKSNPGLKLIISFADTNQGHLGKIYQAGNWIYAGATNIERAYLWKGKILHKRTLTGCLRINQSWGNYMHKDHEAIKEAFYQKKLKRITLKPKHRYLMPLCKQMREQIEKLAQPYPQAPEA